MRRICEANNDFAGHKIRLVFLMWGKIRVAAKAMQ